MTPDLSPPGAARDSTYSDLVARYANKAPDSNIAPFLRLLWDHDLIDCNTNPNDSTLDLRIKVQKLVYLAQRRFDLRFRYAHSMYLYGPYSAGLASDYYRIRDICDTPSGGLEKWGKKGEFLAFAKNHNGAKWLEIASTLIFAHDVDMADRKDELLEHVQGIKRGFPKEFVAQVHADLVREGILAV